jgi:hypothetical protein
MALKEKGRPSEGSPIPNLFPWQDTSDSKPQLSETQACSSVQRADTAELRVNKRERFKTERDQRHGKTVVRIVRLKPGADGAERPAGPALEFAEKHLSGVIAMLQALQRSEVAR